MDDNASLTKINQELLNLNNEQDSKIHEYLTKVGNWSFNVLPFEIITGGQPLVVLGYHLLHSMGVIKGLAIPPRKIVNFLSVIQSRYHKQNPCECHIVP